MGTFMIQLVLFFFLWRKLGWINGDRINGIVHLLVNGRYWGLYTNLLLSFGDTTCQCTVSYEKTTTTTQSYVGLNLWKVTRSSWPSVSNLPSLHFCCNTKNRPNFANWCGKISLISPTLPWGSQQVGRIVVHQPYWSNVDYLMLCRFPSFFSGHKPLKYWDNSNVRNSLNVVVQSGLLQVQPIILQLHSVFLLPHHSFPTKI